jgi:choline-sulfatase
VVDTPSDHTDFYPTILSWTGAAPAKELEPFPGVALDRLAAGEARGRSALSEYHAIGSIAGAFMVRWEHWKYCHYVAYAPQLFDLRADPEELTDLAGDPRCAGVLAEGERRLRARLDPLEVDARAKRRQKELLDGFGGREAALARGDLGFTPAPGTRPDFN